MTEWRVHPTYTDYEVSEDGVVRRLHHNDPRWEDGYCLKPADNGRGYLRVAIFMDGKARRVCVHQLVAETFIGPREAGFEINHIDGNKRNNHYSNLEYTTRSGNMKHLFAIGLRTMAGENNTHTKLTQKQVEDIRKEYATDTITQKALGRKYGITQTHVGYIVNRKSWK